MVDGEPVAGFGVTPLQRRRVDPVGEVLAGIEAAALADEIHDDALAAAELARAIVGETVLLDRLRGAVGSGEITVVLLGGEVLHGTISAVVRDAVGLRDGVDGRTWLVPVWGIGSIRALPLPAHPPSAAAVERLGFTAILRRWAEEMVHVTLRCASAISMGPVMPVGPWIAGTLLRVGADHIDLMDDLMDDVEIDRDRASTVAPSRAITVPLANVTAVGGSPWVAEF